MPLIFEYGLDSPQAGSLLLSFVAAFLSGFLVAGQPSARRTGARMLAVSLLAVLCVIVNGPLLLTAVLLLVATGDALISQEDSRATRLGLPFLLAGHVGYLVLFARAMEISLYASQPWRIVPAIILAVAVLWALRSRRAVTGVFQLPVMALIAVTVASALVAFATIIPGLMVGTSLLVGFAVFLARRFLTDQAGWLPLVSWVLYYASHMLITLAALALI